jgi:hypothetical protein
MINKGYYVNCWDLNIKYNGQSVEGSSLYEGCTYLINKMSSYDKIYNKNYEAIFKICEEQWFSISESCQYNRERYILGIEDNTIRFFAYDRKVDVTWSTRTGSLKSNFSRNSYEILYDDIISIKKNDEYKVVVEKINIINLFILTDGKSVTPLALVENGFTGVNGEISTMINRINTSIVKLLRDGSLESFYERLKSKKNVNIDKGVFDIYYQMSDYYCKKQKYERRNRWNDESKDQVEKRKNDNLEKCLVDVNFYRSENKDKCLFIKGYLNKYDYKCLSDLFKFSFYSVKESIEVMEKKRLIESLKKNDHPLHKNYYDKVLSKINHTLTFRTIEGLKKLQDERVNFLNKEESIMVVRNLQQLLKDEVLEDEENPPKKKQKL